MHEDIFVRCSRLFVRIRLFSSKAAFNKNELDDAMKQLKALKAELAKMPSNNKAKIVMTAAADTCITLCHQENFSALAAFADAVHNLHEVFMPPFIPRRYYWRVYIKPYFKKYGKNEFSKCKRYFMFFTEKTNKNFYLNYWR